MLYQALNLRGRGVCTRNHLKKNFELEVKLVGKCYGPENWYRSSLLHHLPLSDLLRCQISGFCSVLQLFSPNYPFLSTVITSCNDFIRKRQISRDHEDENKTWCLHQNSRGDEWLYWFVLSPIKLKEKNICFPNINFALAWVKLTPREVVSLENLANTAHTYPVSRQKMNSSDLPKQYQRLHYFPKSSLICFATHTN